MLRDALAQLQTSSARSGFSSTGIREHPHAEFLASFGRKHGSEAREDGQSTFAIFRRYDRGIIHRSCLSFPLG